MKNSDPMSFACSPSGSHDGLTLPSGKGGSAVNAKSCSWATSCCWLNAGSLQGRKKGNECHIFCVKALGFKYQREFGGRKVKIKLRGGDYNSEPQIRNSDRVQCRIPGERLSQCGTCGPREIGTKFASAEAILFNIFMGDPNLEQVIDRAKRKTQDGAGEQHCHDWVPNCSIKPTDQHRRKQHA
jgi:hypothetical protein